MSNMLWTPASKPIMLPGRPTRRAIIRPDGRSLMTPRQSGAPLGPAEVDYDDLFIHKTWREYESEKAGSVRYMMFEVSQKNPGEKEAHHFYKAVRMLRLTRVPRWLRQQGSGTGRHGYTQMAYVLSALREQGVLFLQVVAKTPSHPLIYAYGVQGVGQTVEEAQARADEGFATLRALLDGTFQQIEHAPLSLSEAEDISRYSSTWQHVAMARGRPQLDSAAIGAGAILDGNRTDVEQSHNAMEAFIRGMSETKSGFLLSLVTVPLPVEDMTLAWSNVTKRLSLVRSETHGSKSLNFGMAIPLSVGSSGGHSTGDTHTSGTSHGTSTSSGTSDSHGTSTSSSVSDGVSHGQSTGASSTLTEGESRSLGASHSTSDSVSDSQSVSQADGATVGRSSSDSHTQTSGISESLSTSQGTSTSLTQTEGSSAGVSSAQGSTVGQSISTGESSGTSWSGGSSVGGGSSASSGSSSSSTNGTSASEGSSSGVNGGVMGFVGGSSGSNSSSGTSNSATAGTTNSTGSSSSWSSNYSEGSTSSSTTTAGASTSSSKTLTDSFGTSSSTAAALGSSDSLSKGVGQSLSLASGTTSGVSDSVSATKTAGVTSGISKGVSSGMTDTMGTSQSMARGVTESLSTGTSKSVTEGVGSSATSGTSQSVGSNSGISDAYAVAMSRQVGSSGSFGVVPSFGVSVAKQTLDAAKAVIGDILESTMRRYLDGIEGGGGFLYQMFLVAEDRETLVSGAGLLKAAFWGAGTHAERVAQPFHVISDLKPLCNEDDEMTDQERRRLLSHAQAFTSYRRREPIAEIIEPFIYSSYASSGELSYLCRPPAAEGPGLLAVHDSAPVLSMPSDRQNKEITLGRVFNGERARVSELSYGIDADELTHVLVSGVTGSGKTTTLMRLLSELSRVKRTVVKPGPLGEFPTEREVPASILAVDWMRNMRHLGSVIEPVAYDQDGNRTGRFQFFSVREPDLGAFCWNPLALPDKRMHPVEWLNAMADNMVASWNLGEFGRSLIADMVDRLYRANRLEPFELRPARVDDNGVLLRGPIVLDPVDRSEVPDEAIGIDPATGEEVASVYTYAPLSRLIGVEHLAVMVAAELEAAATVEGGRQGTSLRDRLQSLWRRVSYFAPGGQLSTLITYDDNLSERRCLSIDDLVDVDAGLVSVIETDGLDLANRRFVLGSVLLALYRTGLCRGEGCFNQDGKGVGLTVVLEEAHELFGSQGEDEDAYSVSTRTALYESMHRRIRALGARLIDVVQNPGDIPEAVTSNTSTVIAHRTYAEADRKRIFSLLNWSNMIGQQLREWRWLGEMPVGYAIVRLHAKESYLESAPVQIVSDIASMGRVSDEQLRQMAENR